MLFLITCHEVQTDIPLVFIVEVESGSRQRAKRLVRLHCRNRGIEVVDYMHTNMLGKPGQDFFAPIRIDNLLPSLR